ncbi:MAG TPA: hypothetical protein VGI39_39700 [Polyangiaceae bacterium]|jgi:hypothetical protein
MILPRLRRRLDLVVAAVTSLAAVLFGGAGCGASFVGPDTRSDDPHEGWTNCHDPAQPWCPPAYPQCPMPGTGWRCQAAGAPLLGDARDAGSDARADAAGD